MKVRVLAPVLTAAALGLAPAALASPRLTPLPAGVIVAGPGAFATTFATPIVVVPVGTSLTFVNADFAPHSVYAVDGGATPIFSSAVIDGPGATTSVDGTASLAPGSYPFYCSIHNNMTGTLTVI